MKVGSQKSPGERCGRSQESLQAGRAGARCKAPSPLSLQVGTSVISPGKQHPLKQRASHIDVERALAQAERLFASFSNLYYKLQYQIRLHSWNLTVTTTPSSVYLRSKIVYYFLMLPLWRCSASVNTKMIIFMINRCKIFTIDLHVKLSTCTGSKSRWRH